MNNRLRELRAEREWSQADLAERLAVSRQTINAIETGKYDPSLPLAFAIAKLFGLSIESIFSPAHCVHRPSRVARRFLPVRGAPSDCAWYRLRAGLGSPRTESERAAHGSKGSPRTDFFCSELVDRQHGISPRTEFSCSAQVDRQHGISPRAVDGSCDGGFPVN